jgi:hypothetical protein
MAGWRVAIVEQKKEKRSNSGDCISKINRGSALDMQFVRDHNSSLWTSAVIQRQVNGIMQHRGHLYIRVVIYQLCPGFSISLLKRTVGTGEHFSGPPERCVFPVRMRTTTQKWHDRAFLWKGNQARALIVGRKGGSCLIRLLSTQIGTIVSNIEQDPSKSFRQSC